MRAHTREVVRAGRSYTSDRRVSEFLETFVVCMCILREADVGVGHRHEPGVGHGRFNNASKAQRSALLY